MRIEVRAFAMAAGLVAAVLFVVCAIAVALAPEASTAFAGDLVHADLSGIARPLTRGVFVLGLVVWTIGTAITFGLGAWIYNRLVRG